MDILCLLICWPIAKRGIIAAHFWTGEPYRVIARRIMAEALRSLVRGG